MHATYVHHFVQVFAEMFDAIISYKHGGFKPSDKHLTDLDPSKVCCVLVSRDGLKIGMMLHETELPFPAK